MLHLLWEAFIGLIVGAVAKLLMPGKDPAARSVYTSMVLAQDSSCQCWGRSFCLPSIG